MADNSGFVTASLQRIPRNEVVSSIADSNSHCEETGDKFSSLNTSLTFPENPETSYYDQVLLANDVHFESLNPPSEGCLELLNRILSKHDIKHTAVISAPRDNVYVYGDGIEEIKALVEKAFQNFKGNIFIRNNVVEEGTPFTQLFSRVEKYVLTSGEWQTEKKAFCELAAVAQEVRRGTGKVRGTFSAALSAKYCLVPAHILQTGPTQPPNSTYKYTFLTESLPPLNILPTDISKYHIVDKHPGFFMNDIAFFKFQHLPANATANKLPNPLPIPSKAHLDALARRQQVVIVGDAEGRVIFSPVVLGTAGDHLGLHLSFVITSRKSNSTQSLGEGDSGKLVSFKSTNNQLIPAGMVIGKFPQFIPEFNSSIYQAVVLSEALKEIEQDYRNVISDLQVLKIDE